jgi:hypothetical protein
LQNIVVKTKARHMGACVMAACILLNRTSPDDHRIRARHELFIAAPADVAENDDDLIEMVQSSDDDDDEPGEPAAALAPVQSPGREFAALCEDTLGKAAAHLGLADTADSEETAGILRKWAAQLAGLPGVANVLPQQQRIAAPRPWQASSSSSTWWDSSSWWGEGNSQWHWHG